MCKDNVTPGDTLISKDLKKNKKRIRDEIKKDIHLNKKMIVFIMFVCTLSFGIYYSYALFQIQIIQNSIVKIETGNLNVALTSDELINNKTITIGGGDSEKITITITNLSNIDAEYIVYATNNIDNITFYSEADYSEEGGYFKGTIPANSTIIVTIEIENINTFNSIIDFNISAGLPNHDIIIPDNVNIIPIDKLINYLIGVTDVSSTTAFLYSDLIKNTIEKITFENTNIVPNDALGSFDASAKQNESIMAWYYDINDNGLYELYIGGDGGVYANPFSTALFCNLTNLKEIDLTYFKVTDAVNDMRYMFSFAMSLTKLELNNWDTSSVVYMLGMFEGTISLTSLEIDNWDTSNVEDMSSMFYNASSLTSLELDNWDTSKVENMSSMFYDASSLTSLELNNWDTSSVMNMSYMFAGTSSLTRLEIDNWDTSNVEDMSIMFANASSLTSLDLNNWDTSSVMNMHAMFAGTLSLTSLDLNYWDTSNVEDMSKMFEVTISLTSLDLNYWDTSKVEDMSNMFFCAGSLTRLVFSSASFESVMRYEDMFTMTSWDLNVVVNWEGYDFIFNLLPYEEQKMALEIVW